MMKKFLTLLILFVPFCSFSQSNVQPGDSELPSKRFFIGAGLTRSEAIYTGNHLLAEDGTEVKKSDFPFLNLGLDLFANPATRKVIYRMELSFLGGKYKSASSWKDAGFQDDGSSIRTKMEHVFNQYTAQLTPQLIFNIYNSNKFKYFVSGGASLNFSVYKKHENINDRSSINAFVIPVVTADPIDLKSFYFSPRINTGIVLNNKLEVVAGYEPRSSITSYPDYTVGVQRLRLGINLLFDKH